MVTSSCGDSLNSIKNLEVAPDTNKGYNKNEKTKFQSYTASLYSYIVIAGIQSRYFYKLQYIKILKLWL